MNRLMDQWKDKNVANYFVFAKAADSKVYLEAAFTTQVKESELQDAFKKGRLVVVGAGGKMYNPIYVADEKVAVVDTVSSAVAIVEYSAKADE